MNCGRCKWERLCLLEEKLQNDLIQTEDLKLKNKELEEQLRVAETVSQIGRHETV